MENTIEQAKASLQQAKGRLIHVLAMTPDDRINWSPSPTSRTPIQVVVHAAEAVKNIKEMMNGNPFTVPNTTEADKGFREAEKAFSTREEVLGLFEKHCAEYEEFLNRLDSSQLDSMITLPFGMGQAPIGMALTFIPMHTNNHVAQIEYIQTIYGDLDWHMQ